MSAHLRTVIDDAGSFFRYMTSTSAQAACAWFNHTVPDYHAKVEEALDSTEQERTYIVTIWYGRTGKDYACTYGPRWKEDV